MKREFSYEGKLKKEDVMEIYERKIVNLWQPVNYLVEKSFSVKGPGGFAVGGYANPSLVCLKDKVMSMDGAITEVTMERGHIYYLKPSRKITLEQIAENEVKATVEGAPCGVNSVKELLDEIYITGPAFEAQSDRAIAKYLVDNKKLP